MREFQPRHLGAGYVLRVVLLIAFTAGLTWYARQRRNNPFAAEPHIIVAGDSACAYVQCITRNTKEKETCVILLNMPGHAPASRCSLELEKWVLFSFDAPPDLADRFPQPPVSWYTIPTEFGADSAVKKCTPPWPSSSTLRQGTSAAGAEVRFVSAFASAPPLLSVAYGTMKLAIVDSTWLPPDSTKSSPFREAFDIALCLRTDNEGMQRIRRLLRPRYVIALPPHALGDGSVVREQNMLNPSSARFRFDFSKDSRARLRLE